MTTVLIAAHDAEKDIASCINALLDSSYPANRLNIVPVWNQSADRTKDIIDDLHRTYPNRIAPVHRQSGKPGKSAAFNDALNHIEGDIVLIVDARHVPGRSLLKQLVAPFFDPEVGAVMGQAIPMNAATNLFTRMNMKLAPQYGGIVGGLRCSAVAAVGGWDDDMLTEDADIACRLRLQGWKTVYTNRFGCCEKVPEDWATGIDQVRCWSNGRKQILRRYWQPLLSSPFLGWRERLDGSLSLFSFMLPVVLLLGWSLVIALHFMNAIPLSSTLIPSFALVAFSAMGYFAALITIGVAIVTDDHRNRLRLLPIHVLLFAANLFARTCASIVLLSDAILQSKMVSRMTIRYRQPGAKP